MEKGDRFELCDSHHVLGGFQSKGETKKAIHHFEVVFGIASPFNWHDHLFLAHYYLAQLFRVGGRFDDANTRIEHVKSHMTNSPHYLGLATELQAKVWYGKHRLEETRSEALRGADMYEKLGAAKDVEDCRKLLQDIEKELATPVASGPGRANFNCEILSTMLFPTRINSPFSAQRFEQ